jgi:hypothetical protein
MRHRTVDLRIDVEGTALTATLDDHATARISPRSFR